MLLPSYKLSVLCWYQVGSSEKSILILEAVFGEGSHLVQSTVRVAKLAYSVVHLYPVSATVEQGQDVVMLLVELVEYECILVAGRNISLHRLGCFLTKTPLGPLDENPTSF